MSGTKRPILNIDLIKLIIEDSGFIVDARPLVAVVMRATGCTYIEIGNAVGVSRQMAHRMVKNVISKLEAFNLGFEWDKTIAVIKKETKARTIKDVSL